VLADCQRRLDRYRAALEAGTDPAIVQQWIAEVTATRAAALDRSDPALRAQLYEELGIDGLYDPTSHTVHVQVEVGRRIGGVGGGT
jgi:hypothetical protein